MTQEARKSKKTQLALAIAQGIPVATWARASGVSRRAAFYWAKEPSVRETVESCRRRMIDHALGRMTRHTANAADIIIKIANEAKSDSVQLRAARALLSDVMAVSHHAELETRMAGIEKTLGLHAGAKKSAPVSWSPTEYAKPPAPAAKVSAAPAK
jgi:hypothetical protein